MPQYIAFTSGSILFTTQSFTTTSFATSSNITHPYFSGANPANAVTMSAEDSQLTFITASFISRSVSESLAIYGDTTHTGSFKVFAHITQSSNGSASQRYYSFDAAGTASATILKPTASIEMGFDGGGEWRIHKPFEKNPGGISQGSQRTFMYVSRSGRLGFKTQDPKDDIDFKADTIKFRSDDGTNEFEFVGGKIKTKKFKNRSEFAEVVAETSGSEIVLTYTPGTFDTPTTASAGDVLGTVTWEDLSIGNRDDATAMRIQGKVIDVSSGGDAIKGSMNFGIGSSTAGEDIAEVMQVNQGGLALSSSISGYDSVLEVHGAVYVGNYSDDKDRTITFRNLSTGKRWIMGVDENQSRFSIHQGNALVPSNDFEIDTNGNVVIQGTINASGLGSTPIDGGTF